MLDLQEQSDFRDFIYLFNVDMAFVANKIGETMPPCKEDRYLFFCTPRCQPAVNGSINSYSLTKKIKAIVGNFKGWEES